ncbi:MAG TPA: hypothetical protein ENN17_13070 [bacterium]|nr:hypothetical protein [bacterium]
MAEQGVFSDQQVECFDGIVKHLRISLKNCQFYSQDHPLYILSVNNLNSAIAKWLDREGPLNIGVAPDNLFPLGTLIREGDRNYAETAEYLHSRGVVSLSFQKGLTEQEIIHLISVVGQDYKSVIEKGGLAGQLDLCKHIQIKEIDYQTLLRSQSVSGPMDEDGVWQFLFDISRTSADDELPEDKTRFFVDFFSDVNRSVKTLNHVYREAMAKAQDEDTARSLKDAIVRICQNLEKKSDAEARELKVKLMQVISQLHPDLINILLEKTEARDDRFDLVESITRDFSESEIAEFIESLISSEDSFNENLLKVFDKLAPDSEKSSPLVAMVANKLFAKRIVNPDTLSTLQMSIREIFKKHPESNFMNQIYKITVDAVVNRKIDTLVYVARLSPLINKFVQSIEHDHLKKEELWLLLNILWLENDAQEFRKFTDKILELLPELIDGKDTVRIKEIVEFFTEKTRPEQRKDGEMLKEIRSGLGKITDPATIENLLLFVPDASRPDLEDIAYIFSRSGNGSAPQLVETYLNEKNRVNRNKYFFILMRLKKAVAVEVVRRLAHCEPEQVRDLLFILTHCAPQKAHLLAQKLFNHRSAQIRWEALNMFQIQNDHEIPTVFEMYKKEKHKGVQKQAARVLLASGKISVLDRLFRHNERSWFRRKALIELVEVCGQQQVSSARGHLKRLFLKKGIFKTRWRETLRVASLNSLAQMENDDTKEIIRQGKTDSNRRIREISEIILKLEEP